MKPKKSNATKNVSFDHLQAKYTTFRDKNQQAGLRTYDLESLFRKISETDLLKTKRIINGDQYLFHICKYHADIKLWELQILHLREKMLPGIADEFGGYEPIKLADFEYPAESATILYDPNKCILYMQRNKFALSIRNFEKYLMELSPENTFVQLAIVKSSSNIERVKKDSRFRNVAFTVDTREEPDLNADSNLRQILEAFKPYRGTYISIQIRTSKKSGDILDGNQIENLIQDTYRYDGTSKLETSMADPDDLEFETIDMLDDRNRFVIPFAYSRQNPITHERLFNACKAEIVKRYNGE